MQEARPLDGIIWYLSKKHFGNVHDRGVVTITSKSTTAIGRASDTANFTSKTAKFVSLFERSQWVCWDFQEMRIRPTHYTIGAQMMKSWLFEGSVDGENWTEIDRQTDNDDFETHEYRLSFAVQHRMECRFIRWTQLDGSMLVLFTIEFFGTLFESLFARVSAIENKLNIAGLNIRIPMKEPKSRDGIIVYLSKKHGGNVHEKGIVTITCKSILLCEDVQYPPENVADFLNSESVFASGDEPGQWICWDFHEMRIRPTHYTLKAGYLKSWVVEGSVDGENWMELDRETDNEDFRGRWNIVSFAVSNPIESRLIRLTQTDPNHCDGDKDRLALGEVEFFGTLSQ
jgi:hypothetical protein